MYREARIIVSVKEPSRQDLWLHYRGTDLVLEKFESGWVPIGTVSEDFLTKEEADNTFVKRDGNKGLSTNDYTTAEKNKVAKIIIDGTGTKVLADNGSYIEASVAPTVQEVEEAAVTLAVKENTIYTCTTPVTSMTISSVANSTELSIIKFNTGDTAPQFSYPEGTKTTGYKVLVANASYSIFVFAGELTVVRYGE